MKATIVDLRYRMTDVLKAIDRGETVTVLCRGKERARLVPIAAKSSVSKASDHRACGMWAGREDMADPAADVRKIRQNRMAQLLKKA